MTAPAENPTAVRSIVDVAAPPARAFEVFTADFDRWWPRGHHLQSGELKQVGIDPQVGGRLWEESDGGEICVWGNVVTWDPPRVFAYAWLIGPDWGVPPPDAPASRVTVTFSPTGTGTHIELVHDHLDAHGKGWESLRDGVDSDGGWPSLLRAFAAAV